MGSVVVAAEGKALRSIDVTPVKLKVVAIRDDADELVSCMEEWLEILFQAMGENGFPVVDQERAQKVHKRGPLYWVADFHPCKYLQQAGLLGPDASWRVTQEIATAIRRAAWIRQDDVDIISALLYLFSGDKNSPGNRSQAVWLAMRWHRFPEK